MIDDTSIETVCRTGIPGYDPWAHPAGCVFDPVEAQKPIDFFRRELVIPDGDTAGRPFEPLPWQQAIAANIFGWYRPDGTRRYRTVFILVPQKNGKTPTAAGLLMYAEYAKGFPGAQSFFCAADLSQANIAFADASAMVKANPRLDSISTILRGYKTIEIRSNGGIIRALTSDGDTKHGLRPFCFVADELHKHKRPSASEPLVEVLHKKTAGQREPLEIYITTADFQRESICNDKHDAALQVLEDPSLDPYMLPVIWAADKDDDWRDPEVWKKCNPSYGITKQPEYFEQEIRAIDITPSRLNDFKRLDLNIRTGQDVSWLDMDAWKECEVADIEQYKTGPCYVGLDLGSTDDLSALALFWPETEACEVHSFLPDAKLRGKYSIQYLHWNEIGQISATPGQITDYEFIRARMRQLIGRYEIEGIGYDPWNFRLDGARWRDQDGWPMEEFRQGLQSINEPAKQLEKIIKARKLKHDGNQVLRWAASNAEVRPDPLGNIRIVKPKNHLKIDPIVALTMAIGMAMLNGYGDDSGFQVFFSE